MQFDDETSLFSPPNKYNAFFPAIKQCLVLGPGN